MRFGLFLAFLIVLAEFSADVRGKPTIVGCYLRGFHSADSARCDTPRESGNGG